MNIESTALKPIFIHSGLRNGSTYIWNKFRMDPTTMGFYEPFQQALANAHVDFLRNHGPKTWSSKHTTMEPYFKEYEPLLNASGVGIQGFMPEFTVVNYFRNNEELPEQREYLNRLIQYATDHDKTPVLGFSRSIGRIPWMTRNFPDAIHLISIRNPVQQWLSGYYYYLDTKNLNFLTYSLTCIQNPGDHSYIQSIHHAMKEILYGNTFASSTLYEAFLHVYGSTAITALPFCDLLIDIDDITVSSATRTKIEQRVKTLTGLTIDFSDCHVANHPIPNIGVDFQSSNQSVINSLKAWVRDTANDFNDLTEYTPQLVWDKISNSLQSL